MELINDANAKALKFGKTSAQQILVAISAMAPFIASELLETLFNKQLADCTWPQFDPKVATEEQTTIVVQSNGKVRANVKAARGAEQSSIQPEADKSVEKWLADKKIVKVIFVKDRLINFVIK